MRPFVSKTGTSGRAVYSSSFRSEQPDRWPRLGYSASMSRSLALLLMVLLPVSSAGAQTFETAGVRALGMGGAFVAVADDVSAVWWNPAGLATGPFFSLAIERSTFARRSPRLFGDPPSAERSAFFLAAASLPL